MSRSVFSGLLWGVALGAVGLGLISQVTPLPERPVEAPVAAAPERAATGTVELPPAPVQPDPVPAPEPEPAPAPAVPPMQAEARPFSNPQGLPMMAVVLVDNGGPIDRKALAELPFAVSFAINPRANGAAQASDIYRDAGQEVVMLADPDIARRLASGEALLPASVAVMEAELQPITDTAVLQAVEEQGRGLLRWEAPEGDLPQARIFRRLDAGGEDAAVIRNYFDRAAIRAAREGSVILVGDMRAETVSALRQWANSQAGAGIAFAPVTALLR